MNNESSHQKIFEESGLGERYSAKEVKIHLAEMEKHCINAYFKNKDAALLEGGCGSGRLAFALEDRGYTNITAFDFARPLVDDARNLAKARNSKITFRQADASNLQDFPSASFDYIIYSRQLLSFIPMPARIRALLEVRRLLRVGGVAVLTALNRDVNLTRKILLKAFAFRNLFFEDNFSSCELPYLRLGKKFNWTALLTGGPTVTWFILDEMAALVEATGLRVLECSDTVRIGGGGRNVALFLACARTEDRLP